MAAKRFGIEGQGVPAGSFESVFKNVMQSFFFLIKKMIMGQIYYALKGVLNG